MRKLETLTRCSALLSFALLSTACFTPADFGAGVVAESHGEAPHDEAKAEAAHAEEANVIEGIQAGTEGVKLTIKLPEIAYEAPFDGKPLSSNTLESGIVVEEFVLGDGEAVADNTIVSFSFKGYSAATGQPVMGSRGVPTKLMINEATRSQDPIAKALIDGLQGMKKGGKRRITVPAEIVEENAPPGRPAVGNLYMAVELVDVGPVPVLHGIEAFSGEPIDTKKRSNGLEIYDYVAGEGVAAKAGDQVTVHYIGQLTDGSEFDSSHGRAEGLTAVVSAPGTITGFAQGLEGVKVGMLRKIVVPPDIGYGATERPKIPANSTLVFHLQVMSITPGSGAQQDMIVPRNGDPQPAGDKPAGDKPPKPPKQPKPEEGGN
jgi:FKBP-type peptidyl-prolyl cis-trans isomerase